MHGCIKNIIDMAKKAIKYSAFILPFLSIYSYGADVQVFKARSGSLPFNAMVVTNVIINWDIPIMPTDITNAVYIIVSDATNELDKAIIGRGYITKTEINDIVEPMVTNAIKSEVDNISSGVTSTVTSNINTRLSEKRIYDFRTNEALYRAVRDLILINGGSITNYPEME